MALHSKWTSGDLTFYDGTQDVFKIKDNDEGVIFGEDDEGVDVKFYGETSSGYMLWDESEDDLLFEGGAGLVMNEGDIKIGDTDFINFGDENDMTLSWDANSFNIIPKADNANIEFGSGTLAVDVKFFGTTSTTFMQWDSANDKLTFDKADIALGDTDFIKFGDNADITLEWDADSFNIVGTSGNADVELGTANIPLKVKFFGTSGGSDYMQWVSSGSELVFSGSDISMADNDHLYLGSSGDVDMYFNGANDFYILPATDVDNLYLGSTGGDYSWDVIWTGTTGSNTVTFGGASDDVTFTNIDLVLGDSSELQLGDGSSGDWRLYFDAAQLMLEPVTAGDHADFYIGSTGGSLSVDMTWFGDAGTNYVLFDSSNNLLQLEDVDILLGDDDELRFGSTGAGDIVIDFDGTELNVIPAADGTDIFFGSSGGDYSLDLKWFGSTGADYVLFDSANNALQFDNVDIKLGDADYIKFGDASEITARWTTGDALEILPTGANSEVYLGSTGVPLKVKFFGTSGTTANMQWDSSGAELIFDLADISMGDTDYIKFGDGDDFTIACSTGNVLQIIPAAEESDINFGSTAGDKSVDITIYGNDAAHHLKWVSASDELDVTATIEMQTTEKIQFSDTNHYINASTTGQLDIVTDGTLYLNAEITYPTPTSITSTGNNKTLTAASNRTQFLNSSGTFNLIVPTSSGTGVAGIEFKLFNSTGGACTVCESTTGTVIVAIGQGESAIVASNATEWRYIVGST